MLAEATTRAIHEIGEFHDEPGHPRLPPGRQHLDGDVPRADWEAGAQRSTALAQVGRPEMAQELSGDEIRRRTGCPLALAGVLFPDGATVQPAFYARGLRAAALEAGVRIFEHTPMLALRRDRPALIETPRGSVEADAVVLATNAWLARLRDLRRRSCRSRATSC